MNQQFYANMNWWCIEEMPVNDSLIPIEDLIKLARTHGKILVQEIDYKRNIMSQIGNGEAGAKRNIEYLILIKRNKAFKNSV